MGTILVVAEIQKGAIRDASYELVAAARGIEGAEVNGLVIGSGVGDLAALRLGVTDALVDGKSDRVGTRSPSFVPNLPSREVAARL